MHSSSCNNNLSPSDQENLLDKLEVFKVQGRDKRGRKVLRIVGKFFPSGGVVSCEVLKKYLMEKIFPKLEGEGFSVVYLHTGVQKAHDFPALRSIYEAIPINVRDRLQAVYFVHPGLQARLFFATFGRFLFSGGFYGKVKYLNRLEFLWDQVRRKDFEVPEFVYEHDEELECGRPVADYGLESDHPRGSAYYCASTVDNPDSLYSMRCIA